MIVAFTGSRDFDERQVVRLMLAQLVGQFAGELTMHLGDAIGLDTIAHSLCHEFGVDHKTFRAEWERYGKRAGPIRNRAMLKDATLLFAYYGPEGETPGTTDCIRQARRMGIVVSVYDEQHQQWRKMT